MLKPNKKLISFIRATVKPEFQGEVLNDVLKSIGKFYFISSISTLHGVFLTVWIDESLFEGYDPNNWDKYPKHKPVKDGIYRIRYENGGEYLRRWKDGRWYDLSGVVKSNVFYKDSIEFKWFGEEI